MNKLLYVLVFALIIFTGFVNAATLGTAKQGQCIDLTQVCSNCTYVNISSIQYPNQTKIVYNWVMTKQNTDFNYTFCSTNYLGEYIYNTLGDPNGIIVTQPVTFTITPLGNENSGWSIAVNILSSGSSLVLMFLFLYLSAKKSDEEKTVGVGKEKAVIRFFFLGLAMVFLIAHILLTSQIINNTVGSGELSSTYTVMMRALFMLFGLMFVYVLARVSFQEVDNFKRRKGLK